MMLVHPWRNLLPALLVLCASLVLSAAASAQDAHRRSPEERRRHNRERWAELDEKQKQTYRRLHQALQQIPAEKREEIRERLRALRPDQRRRLGQLLRRGADDRIEALERHEAFERFMNGLAADDELRRLHDTGKPEQFREHFRRRMLDHARRKYLRDLSEADRAAFLALGPEEQIQQLKTLLGRGRGHSDRLRRSFLETLTAEQREAFESLDPEDQSARVREFVRAQRNQWIERGRERMLEQMTPEQRREFDELPRPAQEKQLRRFLFSDRGHREGHTGGPPWIRPESPPRSSPSGRPPRHGRGSGGDDSPRP